ncbi:MAG: hypothetical protein AAGD43_03330 [Pseudomonadota bacterium]
MEIKLGPNLKGVVDRIRGQSEQAVLELSPDEAHELLRRIAQAIAAAGINDMAFPCPERLIVLRRDRYRLGLSSKWKGPIPVALEFRFDGDRLWEVEIVEGDESD